MQHSCAHFRNFFPIRSVFFLKLIIFFECHPYANPKPESLPLLNIEYKWQEPHGNPNLIEAKVTRSLGIIHIESAFGIGAAKIKLARGSWPKKVIICLYLKGLEDFEILSDQKTLHKSHLKIRMLDLKGKPVKGSYFFKKEGYFEVTVPDSMLEPRLKEFEIKWIDFYRN